MGIIIGAAIAALGGYDIGGILKMGINMGAVMFLLFKPGILLIAIPIGIPTKPNATVDPVGKLTPSNPLLYEIACLIIADKTAPLVAKFYGLEGVSLPTGSTPPVAICYNITCCSRSDKMPIVP
jgi:galactitol-specific phosphotransferase system IIC component